MSESVLQKAVTYLTEDETKTQSKTKDAISTIGEVAETEGLSSSVLNSLIQFVVGGTGDGSVLSRCQVLRKLIPQTTVPMSTILTSLGAMGSQPLPLKKLLFQWIVLVYDLISDRGQTLHALYDVILYYIQYDELRSIVCQLLCYLTRREDVKAHRVQRLTEIQKRVLVSKEVSESGLVALLSVYRRYCPHLVRLSFTSRRKEWFRPFEKKLAASILRVQGQRSSQDVLVEPLASSLATNSRLKEQMQSLPPPSKRRRAAVPILQPSHIHTSEDNSRVPVGQLNSITELCENIHNLELPSQMAAVLESNLLRHVLCLGSDPSAVIRLTYWLQHYLGYELDSYIPGTSESPTLLHMLKCLKDLMEFILEPIPVVESFLSILLEVWNGSDYQGEVLGLMEHLSFQSFSELEQDYLEPLNSHFIKKDLTFRKLVLSTLTSLFTNLVTLEWPRHKRRTEATEQDSITSTKLGLFHDSSLSWEDDDALNFDPKETLRLFVGYTEHMIMFALREDSDHPLIQHAAATFYEIVTKLPEDHGISLISVPHPVIVYNALVSPDAVTLDRILTCFLRCGKAFLALKRAERGVENTSLFNSLVLDLCDALWKDRAFISEERRYPSLLFKMSKEHLSSCGLPSACDKLSIIHHPALLGLVLKFFKETQDPKEHFQPHAIWNERRFKDTYLDYLKSNKLTGIVGFIKKFIRSS